jgi:hypothetical protein
LWEVATGAQLFACEANGEKVLCVAIAPDGSHLMAAGADGVVRLWTKAL